MSDEEAKAEPMEAEAAADFGGPATPTKLEDERNQESTVILLLLLLLVVFIGLIWLFRRRRQPPRDQAAFLMKPSAEELRDYRLLFDQVDVNGSGHVTTTELLGAFKTLNLAPRGDRISRQIGILDVEKLRKKVDVDKNILIEFDEFVNIVQLEKLDFAETLMLASDCKSSKGVDVETALSLLQKAGFSTNANWTAFIKGSSSNKNNSDDITVDYQHLLQRLEAAITGN